MKRTLCLIMAVLLIAASFCACGGPGGNSIVGEWVVTQDGVEITMALKADGTGSISAVGGLVNMDITYRTEGNQLTLIFEGEEATGEYLVDGDTLTVDIDNTPLVFTRK